jgi:hypothetical protein
MLLKSGWLTMKQFGSHSLSNNSLYRVLNIQTSPLSNYPGGGFILCPFSHKLAYHSVAVLGMLRANWDGFLEFDN